MAVQARQLRRPIAAIDHDFDAHDGGSTSKQKEFQIVLAKSPSIREIQASCLFGCIALALAILAASLIIRPFEDFVRTGPMPRQRTAFPASGIGLLPAISMFAGLVLDCAAAGRLALK